MLFSSKILPKSVILGNFLFYLKMIEMGETTRIMTRTMTWTHGQSYFKGQ